MKVRLGWKLDYEVLSKESVFELKQEKLQNTARLNLLTLASLPHLLAAWRAGGPVSAASPPHWCLWAEPVQRPAQNVWLLIP